MVNKLFDFSNLETDQEMKKILKTMNIKMLCLHCK